MTILADPVVRDAFNWAWRDSEPGSSAGHEEGGFILRDAAGDLRVVRWPTGGRDHISLPPHIDCRIEGREIIATSLIPTLVPIIYKNPAKPIGVVCVTILISTV